MHPFTLSAILNFFWHFNSKEVDFLIMRFLSWVWIAESCYFSRLILMGERCCIEISYFFLVCNRHQLYLCGSYSFSFISHRSYCFSVSSWKLNFSSYFDHKWHLTFMCHYCLHLYNSHNFPCIFDLGTPGLESRISQELNSIDLFSIISIIWNERSNSFQLKRKFHLKKYRNHA